MNGHAHINYLPGLVAGADLSNAQYQVVKFASTAGAVVSVSATTDPAIGILQNDPTAGQPASIAGPGSVATALAGANDIAAGDLLGFNSSGQVVDHTTDGRYHIAQALDGSSAVGDEIRVVVIGLNGHS